MYDIIFKNAHIVDGTGAPWYKGDLAVKDGRIAAIGKIASGAARVVECKDHVLAPGFIDTHAHYESIINLVPGTEANLMQGVTTQICGVCGLSPAPVSDEVEPDVKQYVSFAAAGLKLDWPWRSFGEYFNTIDSLPLGVNFSAYVGHGTLRILAMGFVDKKPSEEELERMKSLLREAMEAGALGMSTGLFYPPGVWSDVDELAELGKVLAEYGGVFASHMRNEADQIVKSVEEVLEVGRRSGCKLQVHHHKVGGVKNWGLVNTTLAMMEKARREEGLDVMLDQYPYAVSATTLRAILPPWAQVGGVQATIDRLKDEEYRKRIIADIGTGLPEWENQYMQVPGAKAVLLFYTPHTPQYQGMNLEEAAKVHGKDPVSTALDIIMLNNGSDLAGYGSMSEEDVKTVMRSPLTMVGSDTIPGSATVKCHPRAFGTFARVLGKYVRDEKVLTLEEAVRKMTSLPAARFGFAGKGVLHVGMDADLVLFDPTTVRDVADFADSARYPEGIDMVVVAGRIAVESGKETGIRAGKLLRN